MPRRKNQAKMTPTQRAAAAADRAAEASAAGPEKFLVFGSRGWIGGQFMAMLAREGIDAVAATTRPGTDADALVVAEVRDSGASNVVSLLGRTWGPGCPNIDYLEGGDPERLRINIRDNLFAPVLLADICGATGVHFTYLGTGCIFKYDDAHPRGGGSEDGMMFVEDDEPNFFGSAYSVVKGFTDRLMHGARASDCTLNVRIRMPVGSESGPRDFVTKIASYERVVDVPNSLTVLHTMLPRMLRFARERRTGTINLVNPGPASHAEVLALYKEIVDPNYDPTFFTLDEQAAVIKGDRSNCALAPTKLLEWDPSVPGAMDATREALVLQVGDKHATDRAATEDALATDSSDVEVDRGFHLP